MRIIRPYARMMTLDHGEQYAGAPQQFTFQHGIRLLQHVEWCARISHRSEDAVTEDSWRRIIESVVMKHGDWSVVEHAVVSVDMVVDRGITHEWVRHRLNAFTQESTRFVNYEKKMPPSFIYPKVDVECAFCLAGGDREISADNYVHTTGPEHDIEEVLCPYDKEWIVGIEHAEFSYRKLLAKGWRPQEARSVFPNALASRIITTSNLRNWRHMFIQRTSAQAHPQMRQVMIPLLKEFQEKIPVLFDDLVPEQQQSEAIKRAR